MSFFIPDRSNRPTDADDPTGGTRELATDNPPKTIELADGRVAVVEAANVDGFHMVYYYFDATGLEGATTADLQAFMARSGYRFGAEQHPEVSMYFSSSATRDAQGRGIWEFCVTYEWG
ncbi:hypothetical protein DV096_19975 [Bradymonadaceae bacterium TMQ3]|uniref:Uncharacterized protein n=1 Tax=Lujinxingia sediminis TaxID=2480984 RepID=A0ABY0CNC6_9DELT|nr:hypothetical protein [Lujinxingia sediminis]RDV36329.1 hypothetical protein DV096_19975 [Bradymonadaceae bacterium TMQ3]RVU41036.1 hypothetical protein EA187_19235 [Lujinxingia sediminis]TXC67915.1 hypothetical protein FRC91_19750 [Bradymonadales bacterium TMQ1]